MADRVLRDHSEPCEHKTDYPDGFTLMVSYYSGHWIKGEGEWCSGGREVTIDYEAVAAVEHDQWVHWTAYMLENNTDENAERWRRQITTPYDELTEAEKDSDREWAIKAIDAALQDLDV